MENMIKIGEKYQEITGANAERFSKDLINIEDNCKGDVVLDFTDVTAISSTAMGSLFATNQKFSEQGRRLTIKNACEKIKRLLQMVNMASVIDLSE